MTFSSLKFIKMYFDSENQTHFHFRNDPGKYTEIRAGMNATIASVKEAIDRLTEAYVSAK